MKWKPINQLTLDDLRRFPIWEHRYDDGREFVRETTLQEITDEPDRGYIAYTEFIFPDGTRANGYSSPQDPSGLDYIQPTIIMAHGHWNIYSGINKPNRTNSALFPLKYKCLVKSGGLIYEDTLNEDPNNKT